MWPPHHHHNVAKEGVQNKLRCTGLLPERWLTNVLCTSHFCCSNPTLGPITKDGSGDGRSLVAEASGSPHGGIGMLALRYSADPSSCGPRCQSGPENSDFDWGKRQSVKRLKSPKFGRKRPRIDRGRTTLGGHAPESPNVAQHWTKLLQKWAAPGQNSRQCGPKLVEVGLCSAKTDWPNLQSPEPRHHLFFLARRWGRMPRASLQVRARVLGPPARWRVSRLWPSHRARQPRYCTICCAVPRRASMGTSP